MKTVTNIILALVLVAAFAAPSYAYEWRHLGGNPCRLTIREAAPRMAFLTFAEKQELVRKFERGDEPFMSPIKRGETLSWMMSGSGNVETDVSCNWDNGWSQVNAFAVDVGRWRIKHVTVCNNWTAQPIPSTPPIVEARVTPGQPESAPTPAKEPEKVPPPAPTAPLEAPKAPPPLAKEPEKATASNSTTTISTSSTTTSTTNNYYSSTTSYNFGYAGAESTFCPTSQAGQRTESVSSVLGWYTQPLVNVSATASGGNPTALSSSSATANANSTATATAP